jgi:MHS family proline/betaine transporter-like MFS transporter
MSDATIVQPIRSYLSELTSSNDAKKRAVSIGIGNFMEWFDFAIYGYFAAIIGKVFFPSAAPGVALLSSLAVFAVGFTARPIGACILGPIGDRFGRKIVLVISVFGMGVATTLIGLLPGYDSIGLAAPALLIALRFVQGAMVGGEWSSAGIYIVESSRNDRRATAASLITGTAGVAFLIGTAIAAALSTSLSEQALTAWGWRVPFVASIVMAAIAMYIRRKLDDTPAYAQLERRRATGGLERVPQRGQFQAIVVALAFSALFGVSLYYFITYANNHLTQTVGLSKTSALWLCSGALVVYSILHPIIGRLSDRFGRRGFALVSAVGLTVMAYPIFLMINSGSHAIIFLGLTILAVLVAITAVMNVVLLVEIFPVSIRSTRAAIVHNVASAVFAGPGPFIAAALVGLTGDPNTPAWYLAGVSFVSFLILWFMLPETKERDIGLA